MSRLLSLKNLAKSAWYGRLWDKMSDKEKNRVLRFTAENDHLSGREFIIKMNQTFAGSGNRLDALAAEILTVINGTHKE